MKSLLPFTTALCILLEQRVTINLMSLLNNFKLKCVGSVILALSVVSPAHAYLRPPPMGQLCAPGSYSSNGTNSNGACTLASPGYYVSNSGATSQTAAPVGRYVSTSGATAPTLASPGSFVNTIAATQPTLAPLGSYVSTSGATAPTLAAPGTYVNTVGATAATFTPVGSYVPTAGAIAPTLASKGYFVANTGSATQTAAPIGQYVNTVGAGVASACPNGSSSYGASVACRVGANLNTVAGVTVSPQFNTILGTSGSIVLGAGVNGAQFSSNLMVLNSSTDLGFSNVLTDLTLLGGTISGGNASLFSLSGFTPSTVLHEGGLNSLSLSLLFDSTGVAPGTYTTLLTFVTDQNNTFGTAGKSYDFKLSATVTAVPEPETYAMLLAGLGLVGWAVRRRKQAEA